MASYLNRYVAFLDVLGFRDLISRSTGTAPIVTVDDIRAILTLPGPAEEQQIVLGRIGDISQSDHRVSAFSDSIVITTDETEHGLMHLLHHVAKVGYYLARLGVLYRGGIAGGLVYHDNQQVFGPAVIEAYQIEQMAACPRVLLSPTVVKAGRAAEEPICTVFGRLTRTDCDGGVFVHYLRVLRMIADSDGPTPNDVLLLQNRIRAVIDQQLQRFEKSSAEWTKWDWFNSYFNWATDDSWREALNAPFPAHTMRMLGQ